MSQDSSAAHTRLEVPMKKQGWCQMPPSRWVLPTPKNLLIPRGKVKDGEPQDLEGFNRQSRAVAVPVSQICETQG